MFGALVCILLGADQAKGCAVVARERGWAKLISQQHIRVERILERQGGAEAIRTLKQDMAHTRRRTSFGNDDRFIERPEWHTTPVQARHRPTGDAVEVSDDVAPREFGEAGEGDLEALANRS